VAFGDDVELVLARAGDSRRKLLGRMPARALVHRWTLVTMNADSFRGIAGLEMLAW
jgi:hypothetical protein